MNGGHTRYARFAHLRLGLQIYYFYSMIISHKFFAVDRCMTQIPKTIPTFMWHFIKLQVVLS